MSRLPDNVRELVAEIETEIGESGNGSNGAAVEDAVREILLEIGEDPDREGLRGTPDRVHRMYAELTAGYHVDPDRLGARAHDFQRLRQHGFDPDGVAVGGIQRVRQIDFPAIDARRQRLLCHIAIELLQGFPDRDRRRNLR